MKKIVMAVLLLMAGYGTAGATDVMPFDVTNDSIREALRRSEWEDCCGDSTVADHKSRYHKLVKKGGSVGEGLFTVRHIEDEWYLEVPDELLGRMLLCVTRFTGVPQGFKMFSGEEVNRSAVYLEQYNDETVFLREYVQSSYAQPGDRIAVSLGQSTTDPVVYKFEVIGRNPKTQAQLVNVTKWLMSENKVTNFSSADRTELGIGGVQTDRTFIDSIKAYPINIEIQTLRTYAAGSQSRIPAARTGSVTLSLNTSVVLLPERPMQPRYADERVGYFNSRITAFSDEQQTTDHEAIVMRYRLEPKDSQAYKAGRLTEPRQPIVFYIDPATPEKWVKYLIAGINDWNAAFEAAGFKNAIVGREWPENDSTMSVDDARFSMIRYLPSETENAYGPRIVDPRSGEIIEAHVCWYHNVMNLVKKWYMVQCGPLDKRAQTMDFPDELMGELIRFVSSHEVGHALGLRHNMIASQATPVEKLRDKAWVERYGHTASIMDYARFNYVAQPEDKVGEKGLFPRINDYDKWAVKWGYQYRPEFKSPTEEKRRLRAETTKMLENNRRLWWAGDEGRGNDPRSQAEDLGDNQMRANEYGMRNLRRVVQSLEKWTAQPDEQYDDLEEMHNAVVSQYVRYVNHVMRYVGGRYTNKSPGQRANGYVERDLQREAVQWLGRHVMEPPTWLYPGSIVGKTGINYAESIRLRQQSAITTLLSPTLIMNQHNAALRVEQPYGVGEYLDDVFATVWKPTDGQDEELNDFRRHQQRVYVDQLGSALNLTADPEKPSMATSVLRSDAMLYVEQHLDKVEQHVQSLPANAHNKNLLLRIKKIREKYESGK